jgi:hypothetical protein
MIEPEDNNSGGEKKGEVYQIFSDINKVMCKKCGGVHHIKEKHDCNPENEDNVKDKIEDERYKIRCSECGKRFKDKNLLNNHNCSKNPKNKKKE